MSLTSVSALAPKTNTLFDSNNGYITPRFKRQLELVGIVSKQFFPEYDPYHVINVDQHLQTNGCFQKDWDLYKNGGSSTFKITYAQATAFLDDEYSDREMIMPREKGNGASNAIFPCGVEATMRKRFISLRESIEKGFKYDIIHFITLNTTNAEEVKQIMTEKQYQELLEGIKVNIVIAESNDNIFEKGLGMLAANPSLGNEYVIITDPTLAPKVEGIATSILKDRKCLGIASAPIKDWKIDMNLYGYESSLKSHESAVIAWASSAWNFKARQVNTEMKAYKTTHLS